LVGSISSFRLWISTPHAAVGKEIERFCRGGAQEDRRIRDTMCGLWPRQVRARSSSSPCLGVFSGRLGCDSGPPRARLGGSFYVRGCPA
jgi:hypothetical protein